MKKISLLAALAFVLSLTLAGSAGATIVEVPNPGDQFWDSTAQAIAAKVQNGQFDDNGSAVPPFFQLVMGTTDLNNSANVISQASETPWVPMVPYHFTLEYVNTTNFSGSTFLSVTGGNITPTFGVGVDFGNSGDIYTIRLNYVGGSNSVSGAVNISNLTLNNVPMGAGTYNSGSSNNFVYFRNLDNTPFTKNFTIAGDFEFTGSINGYTPRFEFDLSFQPVPPSITQILSFFDTAVANGDLTGKGPGNSANGRLGALRNMLQAAAAQIAAGDTEGAYHLLLEAYQKTDGDTHIPDFVDGAAAATLAQMILDLDNSLKVSSSLAFDPPPGGGPGIFLNTPDVSAVPLPPSVLLLGSGLLSLAGLRRLRKS